MPCWRKRVFSAFQKSRGPEHPCDLAKKKVEFIRLALISQKHTFYDLTNLETARQKNKAGGKVVIAIPYKGEPEAEL